jgi:hypothetical protein
VDVISFLRFVYLDCYGDIYQTDDPRFQKYHEYLTQQLAEYEQALPEEISIT